MRKEYDESSGKLSKIQSRISNLKQKLKQDFGIPKTWRKPFLIVILFTLACACIGFQYLQFILLQVQRRNFIHSMGNVSRARRTSQKFLSLFSHYLH